MVVALAATGCLLGAACAGTGSADLVDANDLGEEVASSEPTDSKPAESGPVTGLLYVAEAGSGQIDGDWPTVNVTLSEVDAEVLWFQDRPGRDAGEIRMAEFVDQWAEIGFADMPPNAVIRHDAGEGLGTVVEMSDPTWDQPTGNLSFTATVADYESGEEPLPWLMSDVSLFIDDGGSSYQPVKLSIADAQPGQEIAIDLSADGPNAPAWSLGQMGSDSAGVSLEAQSAMVPIDTLTVNNSQIRLATSASGGTGASLSMSLDLFLELPAGTSSFYVSSSSNPGVEVQLAIGNSQPEVVNASQTPFAVDPA